MASLILHQFKEGVAFNLFKRLSAQNKTCVSNSAFTQARAKIGYSFFRDISQVPFEFYKRSARKVWKGHPLIGVDGSTLNMPTHRQMREYFGEFMPKSGQLCVLARFTVAYDVLNHFNLSCHLSPYNDSEQDMAVRMLSEGPVLSNGIYLFDRGFAARWFIEWLTEKGINFCVRIHTANNFIKDFMDSEEVDKVVEWPPSKNNIRTARERGMEARPFKVRLVKVELPQGQTELLATSLMDETCYTSHEMKELYGHRWGAEEGIKKWKSGMKVEMFGARTVNGIYQELYAHQFMANLIAILGMEAQGRIENQPKRRYFYRYNWMNAYRVVKLDFYNLLYYKRRDRLLDGLIVQMASEVVPCIEGRKFPRSEQQKGRKRRVNTNVKQA